MAGGHTASAMLTDCLCSLTSSRPRLAHCTLAHDGGWRGGLESDWSHSLSGDTRLIES